MKLLILKSRLQHTVGIIALLSGLSFGPSAVTAASLDYSGGLVVTDNSGPLIGNFFGTPLFSYKNLDNGSISGTAINGFSSLNGINPADISILFGDMELISFSGGGGIAPAIEVYGDTDGSLPFFDVYIEGVLAATASNVEFTIHVDATGGVPVAFAEGSVTLNGIVGQPFFDEVLALTDGTGQITLDVPLIVPSGIGQFTNPITIGGSLNTNVATVPLPASLWLFLTGILFIGRILTRS